MTAFEEQIKNAMRISQTVFLLKDIEIISLECELDEFGACKVHGWTQDQVEMKALAGYPDEMHRCPFDRIRPMAENWDRHIVKYSRMALKPLKEEGEKDGKDS